MTVFARICKAEQSAVSMTGITGIIPTLCEYNDEYK